MFMAVIDEIVHLFQGLSPEQQVAVRKYAETIAQTNSFPIPSENWIGICAGEGIHLTEEDIAEARREMWGNFPRDIVSQ
jgi:hypothetical protein